MVKGILAPHEINENEKYSKNRLYGLTLVLWGKIAVGEAFTEIISV